MWIRAFVSEPLLGEIYPGMPAEVITDPEKRQGLSWAYRIYIAGSRIYP